jgi:hypothetical protein
MRLDFCTGNFDSLAAMAPLMARVKSVRRKIRGALSFFSGIGFSNKKPRKTGPEMLFRKLVVGLKLWANHFAVAVAKANRANVTALRKA